MRKHQTQNTHSVISTKRANSTTQTQALISCGSAPACQQIVVLQTKLDWYMSAKKQPKTLGRKVRFTSGAISSADRPGWAGSYVMAQKKWFDYKQVQKAHLISSNSPSAGMKLMFRSDSNLLSFTHWWNVQSSIAIDGLPLRNETFTNNWAYFQIIMN